MAHDVMATNMPWKQVVFRYILSSRRPTEHATGCGTTASRSPETQGAFSGKVGCGLKPGSGGTRS